MDLREVSWEVVWICFSWLRIRTNEELFEYGNETSGFIKVGIS
jgi:hypothetical protein